MALATMSFLSSFRRLLFLLSLNFLLAACSSFPFTMDGDAAPPSDGQRIAALEKAARDNPRDPEKKAALIRQREQLIAGYLDEAERHRSAGRPDAAEEALRRVLQIDARHTRAMQELERIVAERRHTVQLAQGEQLFKKGDLLGAERNARNVRAQDPNNATARQLQRQIDTQREKEQGVGAPGPAVRAALAKPIAMEFRDATLKSVFEVLSRSSGLNFVFDKDVKGDTKITFFVRNSPLEDILQLILSTNQLARRQLNDNSFLIYPNTAPKGKEYQELVVRSFYLVNTDVKQALAAVKNIAKSKDVFADEKLNLLIVKDTPDAIRLIERLIESIDLSEPEVMLEVEVLEVSRSRLNEFGLDWPDYVGYGQLQDATKSTTIINGVTQSVEKSGGSLASGYLDIRKTGTLSGFVANPGFTFNIKGQNADTNLLANPRIRVKNREKAKIHIGERLPVFTTTSTANVGVSASVSYLDIGLKLDVESNITLDNEVSMKVGLEVSSIVKEVLGPSNSLAYQIGTRSTSTVLRLKDGETQVLAGLISDEERKSTSHVPGVGEIPVLGRLFGSQRNNASKTEIILLITPRVVRNIHRPEFAPSLLPSGTEAAVGAPPLRIRNVAPKALGMSTRGTGVPTATEKPTPAAAPEKGEESTEKPAADNAPAGAASATPGAALKLGGPAEAVSNSEFELTVSVPTEESVNVSIAYDPTLLEARQPPPSASGRVSLRVDGGQGSLRLHTLPGSGGETSISITGITLENGSALQEGSAAHRIRIKTP